MQGDGNYNNNSSSVGGYVPPQQESNGAAEGGQDYYYYYEMPDGSIGYMTANEYNQMYSPNEQQQQAAAEAEQQQPQEGDDEAGPQPAGYVEPTYGQGTAYAPQQQQQQQYAAPSQLMNNNNSNYVNAGNTASDAYYGYDNTNGYGEAAAPPPPVVYAEPPGLQQMPMPPPPVVYDGDAGMTPAPVPELPHAQTEGGWYVPPPTFAAMRQWDGSEQWSVSLCRACCRDPCFCLGACVAPWCVVAAHRRRLLQKDCKQYRCCAGLCGRVGSCACCGGQDGCCRGQDGCCRKGGCCGGGCMCRGCCQDSACCGDCTCGGGEGEESCCTDCCTGCSSSCGDNPRCNLIAEVLFCLPCACQANQYMMMQRYNLKRTCWDSTVLSLGCFCAPCHWCSECSCWFPESMWDWLYVLTYACMLTQHHRELDNREKVVL